MCEWSELQLLCVRMSEEISYNEIVKEASPFVHELNKTTPRGTTPLHFAMLGSNDNLVKFLIKNGAKFKVNDDQESPLHWACNAGDARIVKKLLRFLSAEEIGLQDTHGKRAIDWALENDRDDLVCLIKGELKRKAIQNLKRRHSAPKQDER